MSHRWSAWKYDRRRRMWDRRCVVGHGHCTALESVPRGKKPKS